MQLSHTRPASAECCDDPNLCRSAAAGEARAPRIKMTAL